MAKLTKFSWKRRLDFDACTMCGRCQDVCPAGLARTPLSPKRIISGGGGHMWMQIEGRPHGTPL